MSSSTSNPVTRHFPTPTSLADALIALFDHLPDVFLFVKDLHHRFRHVNRALWSLHACRSAADMIGKTDADFHPPVLARQYVDEDERVTATGVPQVNRVWLVPGADGRPRWYTSTKLPLREATGAVIGVAGILRPRDTGGSAPGEYARLTPALEHVLARYDEPIEVCDLAGLVCLSVSQFQREFRRLFGMTPRGYVQGVRLQAARTALETTANPIGAVAAACGFYDQSYFVKRFRAAFGLRPLDYRRRFGRAG